MIGLKVQEMQMMKIRGYKGNSLPCTLLIIALPEGNLCCILEYLTIKSYIVDSFYIYYIY